MSGIGAKARELLELECGKRPQAEPTRSPGVLDPSRADAPPAAETIAECTGNASRRHDGATRGAEHLVRHAGERDRHERAGAGGVPTGTAHGPASRGTSPVGARGTGGNAHAPRRHHDDAGRHPRAASGAAGAPAHAPRARGHGAAFERLAATWVSKGTVVDGLIAIVKTVEPRTHDVEVFEGDGSILATRRHPGDCRADRRVGRRAVVSSHGVQVMSINRARARRHRKRERMKLTPGLSIVDVVIGARS